MEIGWTKPTKESADWDDANIKAANFNSRALNALFSAVTNEEFKKISSTKTAKEAYPDNLWRNQGYQGFKVSEAHYKL